MTVEPQWSNLQVKILLLSTDQIPPRNPPQIQMKIPQNALAWMFLQNPQKGQVALPYLKMIKQTIFQLVKKIYFFYS